MNWVLFLSKTNQYKSQNNLLLLSRNGYTPGLTIQSDLFIAGSKKLGWSEVWSRSSFCDELM